ncbi:MAG: hypothetical protein H0X28_02715 [Solirubrobacterales bacterium]|nr:hypothetical protein [Solirubrobacterales bacterium]
MSTTDAGAHRDDTWGYGYTFREIEAMDRFDAFEAGVTAGENQARQQLRGWVLLIGDPREGFDVVGPFPSKEAAEARASCWDDTDWWPIELQQRDAGEPKVRVGA